MLGNNEFRELSDKFGSAHAAVMYVVRAARKLAAKYDYIILDSEAISWVLTGERPKVVNKYIQCLDSRKTSDIAYIDDILSGVDDEEVCNCVKESIKESRSSNHLIYLYKGVLDDCKKARIRILTRIIWYNLHNYIN